MIRIPDKMPTGDVSFEARGGWVVDRLCDDLALTPNHAAAIVGNLGYESAGFATLQELTPISGRGGYGWAQWTGPRRVAFEEWCQKQGLDAASDAANYGYLINELQHGETHALAQTVKTTTLEAAVFTFGAIFERPYGTTATHLPGYDGRLNYAHRAIAGATVSAQLPASPAVAVSSPHVGIVGGMAGGLGAAIAVNLAWLLTAAHITVPVAIEQSWIVLFTALGAWLVHRNSIR